MYDKFEDAVRAINSGKSTREELQRASYFVLSEYYRIAKYEKIGQALEYFISERIEGAICP